MSTASQKHLAAWRDSPPEERGEVYGAIELWFCAAPKAGRAAIAILRALGRPEVKGPAAGVPSWTGAAQDIRADRLRAARKAAGESKRATKGKVRS